MTRTARKAAISPDTGEVARDAEFIAPKLSLASEHLQQERRSGCAEQDHYPELGIMELNSHTCHWPFVKIGSEDIRFCGNRTLQG